MTTLRIVPLPHTISTGNAVLCLSDDFQICLEDDTAPADLIRAVQRTHGRVLQTLHQYLSPTRGREFLVSTGGSAEGCQHYLHQLRVVYEDAGPGSGTRNSILEEATRSVEDRKGLERYKLDVRESGSAVLSSGSSLGLLRGLTTFEQLFYHVPPSFKSRPAAGSAGVDRPVVSVTHDLTGLEDSTLSPDRQAVFSRNKKDRNSDRTKGHIYTPFAPYHIEDEPAFPWRAVLLDTSRHFFSKQVLMAQLDAMSLVKLNVFQW